MTTLRKLLLDKNINYVPSKKTSLDEWLSNILDIPLEELDIGDIARAIRQSLFLAEILPIAEIILMRDPLAGDDYDGQLISSIASLSSSEAKKVQSAMRRISTFLNQLEKDKLDSQVNMNIAKIDKLSRA